MTLVPTCALGYPARIHLQLHIIIHMFAITEGYLLVCTTYNIHTYNIIDRRELDDNHTSPEADNVRTYQEVLCQPFTLTTQSNLNLIEINVKIVFHQTHNACNVSQYGIDKYQHITGSV